MMSWCHLRTVKSIPHDHTAPSFVLLTKHFDGQLAGFCRASVETISEVVCAFREVDMPARKETGTLPLQNMGAKAPQQQVMHLAAGKLPRQDFSMLQIS